MSNRQALSDGSMLAAFNGAERHGRGQFHGVRDVDDVEVSWVKFLKSHSPLLKPTGLLGLRPVTAFCACRDFSGTRSQIALTLYLLNCE